MSTAAYDWLENSLERAEPSPELYPCEPSASQAWRQAVTQGDAARARNILQTAGRAALDVPRLPDVMHAVARLALVPDVLRAGLSAAELTQSEQELWVMAVVTADRPADAAALLRGGFAGTEATLHDVALKAIRSGAWREVASLTGTEGRSSWV